MFVAIVVLLAVLAAAVVSLLALGQAPRGDGERPLEAFRRGLRARRHPDAEQLVAAKAAAADPVDVSLREMLKANIEYGEAYTQPSDLAESWQQGKARVRQARRSLR